jgi:hypothetical protein
VAKLTREQIIAIEDELAVPYGMVRLMCDGYRVDIHVSQVKPLKYELMVYVNGEWKGSWVKGDCEEAKRFMRPMHRHKYTTEFRTGMTKVYGVRRVRKEIPDLDAKVTHYSPTWSSAKPMLRHFAKTCGDIQLVCIGYPKPEAKAA